ncbi:MAG: hypothetical protein K6B41_14280 [Butyrivibrio sp.]|nr:hypothetical protein [Butyrivibrio sp.]
MRVNVNVSAMVANNALKTNDNLLTDSLERLSNGLKIVNAKDNPSGLAMARRMNAQIKSLEVASDSSSDGISVIETADGALSEVHDILQRMNELSVQAANGTVSDNDRKNIQDEIDQLKQEITRISEATEFNGQQLLNGVFDLKGYATVEDSNGDYVTTNALRVSSYSDSMKAGFYEFDGLTTEFDEYYGETTVDPETISVYKLDSEGVRETDPYLEDAKISVDGDIVKIANEDGDYIELKVNYNLTGETMRLELTAKGAMQMQIGANEDQTIDIRMPNISLSHLGLEYTDVTDTIDTDVEIFMKEYAYDDTTAAAVWSTFTSYATPIEAKLAEIEADTTLDEDEKEELVENYENILLRLDDIDSSTLYTTDQERVEAFASIYYISKYTYEDLVTAVDDATTAGSTDAELGEELYEILTYSRETALDAPYVGADKAIEDISNAIKKVSEIRARLGAYENRLEHTVKNLDCTGENMTSAYSRIMDVDMADEMTIYSTQQVLSQAGTSMLAQANERPSQILQLLQ